MPKKRRITRADFSKIGKSGSRRYPGIYFSLTVSPNLDGVGTKVTSVVSKKVSKSAVVRNRIRRRCREIARVALAQSTKSTSLIFYAKKEAITATFLSMGVDIKQMISHI